MRYGNEAEIMTVKKMMVDRLIEMNTQELQVEPEENEIIDFYPEDLPLKVNLTILSLNQNFWLSRYQHEEEQLLYRFSVHLIVSSTNSFS